MITYLVFVYVSMKDKSISLAAFNLFEQKFQIANIRQILVLRKNIPEKISKIKNRTVDWDTFYRQKTV